VGSRVARLWIGGWGGEVRKHSGGHRSGCDRMGGRGCMAGSGGDRPAQRGRAHLERRRLALRRHTASDGGLCHANARRGRDSDRRVLRQHSSAHRQDRRSASRRRTRTRARRVWPIVRACCTSPPPRSTRSGQNTSPPTQLEPAGGVRPRLGRTISWAIVAVFAMTGLLLSWLVTRTCHSLLRHTSSACTMLGASHRRKRCSADSGSSEKLIWKMSPMNGQSLQEPLSFEGGDQAD